MDFLRRFKRDKKHVLLFEHTGWSIAWYGCSRDVASHSGGAIRDGIRWPWPIVTPAVIWWAIKHMDSRKTPDLSSTMI
jgi:hypothetical protein